MSECWHYIRFGTISDGTITGMHCTLFRISLAPLRGELDNPLRGLVLRLALVHDVVMPCY